MAPIPDRDTICRVLETREHPLRRLDLVLEAFWDAGYNRNTYRSAYDLPETHIVLARLIDRMRKDGALVLLPGTRWKQLLGNGFQPQRIAHGHRGGYWYATAAQHTRWRRAAAGRQARIAAIAARLTAAGPLPQPCVTEEPAEGCRPGWDLPAGTGPRSGRETRAEARAELLAHAPADLAFLLSLVEPEGCGPARRYVLRRPLRAADPDPRPAEWRRRGAQEALEAGGSTQPSG
ncbi:hypothetical protein [Streptomyces orinoci]|uniref:Uncharacterized protein n=1 Tax=Streptomyces orinoci TaxID=67339 RepID=A0ABV3K6L1_STRON|nr:hypothetical protein [Streptomyces orinoci]